MINVRKLTTVCGLLDYIDHHPNDQLVIIVYHPRPNYHHFADQTCKQRGLRSLDTRNRRSQVAILDQVDTL